MAVLYYRNSEGNLLPISFGGSESYTLPVASENTLGGIKSGNDITISSTGEVTVNSINGKTVKTDVPENAVFTDTLYTLPAASEENLGGVKVDVMINGMSTDDKVPTSKAAYDCIKAYTDLKIADLVGTAPETMDTIEEIATAMQENHDVVEALDLAIGQKANKTDLTALETSVNNELDTKVDKDNIPVATAEKVGGVKPDNTTLSVDGNGVLSAQKAIDSIETAFLRSQIPEKNLITAEMWENADIRSWYSGKLNPVSIIRDSFWTKIEIVSDMLSNSTFTIRIIPPITIKSGRYLWSVFVKTDIPYDYLQNNTTLSLVQDNKQYRVHIKWEIIDTDSNIYMATAVITRDAESSVSIYISFDNAADSNLSATYYSVSYPLLEQADTPSLYFPTGYYTTQKSNAKLAAQIAHPNNYLIYDDLDKPSAMVAIPKFYLDEVINGAEHIVHPAFMVNGVEQNAIYISKYQNIIENDRAYSLPMKEPAVNINFDQSWSYCKNKGTGWHLMTNAEWAAIALWCKKNGTMPRGNNNYGKDISETGLPQKAITASIGSDGKINRVLTGSGRESWYHDGTYAGIADLNGNVWEWIGDIRLVYGELQVIPFNNAASGEYDLSANSSDWKAINANATSYDDLFITPDGNGTTTNSVKLDWVSDHWQWNKTITTQQSDGGNLFAAVTSANMSITVNMYLQAIALLPDDGATANDYGNTMVYFSNTMDNSYGLRGGFWSSGSTSIFRLNIIDKRSQGLPYIGARSAYINTSTQPLATTLELSDEFQMNNSSFENATLNTKETI